MKRKWEDPQGENFNSPTDNIELHLETPLPLEWQRCLDIQSGEIHFFNTKTQKRTSMDPRRNKLERPTSTTTPNRSHGSDHQALSLDLELNLNCQSKKKMSNINDDNGGLMKLQASNYGISCPWLRFEREQQEMVARVCMQCHLLVMLLKSSPTCPNCKFIHPITDHHQYLQNNPPTTTTTTTFFLPNSLPNENNNNNHHQTQSLKSFFPNPIQNKV